MVAVVMEVVRDTPRGTGKDTTLGWQLGDSSMARRFENRLFC